MREPQRKGQVSGERVKELSEQVKGKLPSPAVMSASQAGGVL